MDENAARWRKRLMVGLVLLAALVAAAWFGRPAYHRYQARRSFTQAREFLAKGDLNNGTLSLRRAIVLDSSNVEALRLMAGLASRLRSPAAVSWWQRVVEAQPTVENKTALASVALQFERPPFLLTSKTLEEIKVPGETNVAYQLVAVQRDLRLNQISNAQAHLEIAMRLEPTNRMHQLNLAVLRLQDRDAGRVESAKAELEVLASDPALGQHALRSLCGFAMSRKHWQEAEAYSRRLLALPEATFEDQLQRLTLWFESHDAALAPGLTELQPRAATNAVQASLLANWLNQHDRAREALAWLATVPTGIRDTMPAPLAEAECFVSAKDWPGLETRLKEQRWDELEFLRLAFLARAARELNRLDVSGAQWDMAVNATAGHLEQAVQLLRVADEWGWEREADDLLWVLSKRILRNPWPLQALIQRYTARTNSAGLYRVYQALLERNPDSPVLKNNVANFALLLHRDLSKANALAQAAYTAQKTNAFFLSTYAFAMHVQGKTAEGLKLLETLPVAELQRPEIALYAAVLMAAAGEQGKAAQYAKLAEPAHLLPEERELLSQLHAQPGNRN